MPDSTLTTLRHARPLATGAPLAAAWLALALAAGCGGPANDPNAPAAATASAPAAPGAPTGAADRDAAAQAITADGVRAHVAHLASDELGGRGPGSAGDQAARDYLAKELAALGLKPGNGTSWEQPLEMLELTTALPPSWSFRGSQGTVDAKALDDFVVGAGRQEPRTTVTDSELVFVGYGIEAPEYGWDDFKGVDVAGKTLVMLNNDPDWDDGLFAGKRRLYYGRWTYKYESAARHGAAGALIVHTTPSAGYNWSVVRSSWGGVQYELPQGEEPRIGLRGWLTEDAARRVLAAGGHDLDKLVAAAQTKDFAPVSLGVTTSLTLDTTSARVTTANVLGLLPGGDPTRRDEVVVFTAHHDHFGTGDPDPAGDPEDRIYNGARDNAAGVAQILAVAKAFAALPQPPRRSLLFLFVAAEERGLLGSGYYAAHPTVQPGRIAANVNLDAPGIWGRTTDITYVGLGKSSLDQLARDAAALQGRSVVGDPFPEKGSFYRSDQFSFAKIGVPALYLDNGVELVGKGREEATALIEAWEEKHYHKPSDELGPDWDFAGIVEDAQVAFYAGLAIADADAMPTWNAGDEFEAARQRALAAVGAKP